MSCFKDRVEQFYARFSREEPELRTLMDNGEMEPASRRMRELLQPVLGDLTFQLYKKPGCYILECSTMLDSGKKIPCFYFCDCLPEKLRKHWTFYYYHPAFRGSLTIGDTIFSPQDFRIIPSVNEKLHKIDLKISLTEKFTKVGDEDRFAVTYMMLMDYLGEIAAEAYAGQISFSQKSKAFQQALSMEELRTFLQHTIQSKGWVKPGDIRLIADSFQLKNRNRELRRDILHGISYSLDLLNEEEKPTGDRAGTQYILSCGIRYGSLVLPRGKNTEEAVRREQEKWEKRLSEIFSESRSGTIVTSSVGNTYCYLDFFAYDDETYQLVCREASGAEGTLSVLDLGTFQAPS